MEEESYGMMAPKGQFGVDSLNALVKASNRLLPLFGQTPDYPSFSQDATEFPSEFVRVIGMFAEASSDAAEAGMIEPELVITLDGITDDTGVRMLAGKVNALAGNREFKRFLKEPQPEKPMAEGAEMEDGEIKGPSSENQMSEEDLFLSRM